MSFYDRDDRDRRCCRVCGAVAAHVRDCPIPALVVELHELVSHLGIFVGNMHDTLDTMEGLLTDRVETKGGEAS